MTRDQKDHEAYFVFSKKTVMNNLPMYIPVLFIITTMLTFLFISRAFRYSKLFITVIIVWLSVQALVATTGFYTQTSARPPKLLFALLPPIVAIVFLLTTSKGKKLTGDILLPSLTLLHIVRIPVEIVLFLLFINGVVPGIMTYEGSNFDIISGITAPFVYYFAFVQRKLSNKLIIAWNLLCLLLLSNIVITAILSAPFPFQKFAFEQPNIAVLYAPYIWLPSFIVPVVLFAHLVTIKKLIAFKKTKIASDNKFK